MVMARPKIEAPKPASEVVPSEPAATVGYSQDQNNVPTTAATSTPAPIKPAAAAAPKDGGPCNGSCGQNEESPPKEESL